MLRNQFPGKGKLKIPIIPKFQESPGDFDDLLLIGFDKTHLEDQNHLDRMVHFFLYDYRFERVWKNPDNDIEKLSRYRAVLSPDFSMYLEMAPVMQLYNVFRNRWCGAYWASKGLRVIPTVNWGDESTFDFCFEGIEKGSVVAVSTYMASEHDNRCDQKEWFMAGYNEMLRRIEPENIICYNSPFPEMQGNIIHVFGTDNLGRDQLSRLIYGSRYSLAIGFLAVGISVITGGILGVLAAYYPKLDNIIMRCMDLFMAIPQMLLAMCIVTALGSSLFNLMLAVGLSSTPKFARVVRAAVMSTREQEFVEAARAIGANNWRIIVHHILPNSISSLIVQATLAMAGAIISASALSFLGFGIQAPLPEWGAMLSTGRRYIRTEPYLTVIPGLAIMVVVYALNVVGDGLRDCLDPRLKK